MKFPLIKVISLKDELKRRDSISSHLRDMDLLYDFFDAIDFRKKNASSVLEEYLETNFYSLKRPLTNGEIGCSLSHIKVYDDFLASDDDWLLVLEDDANFRFFDKRYVEEIISVLEGSSHELVILGYSKLAVEEAKSFYLKEPIKVLYKTSSHFLGKPWKNWTSGTVSYLINKNGAKKIVERYSHSNNKIETVADDWLFFEKVCDVDILHCRPLLVFEDFHNHSSAIEDERKLISKKYNHSLEWIRIGRGFFRRIIMGFKF